MHYIPINSILHFTKCNNNVKDDNEYIDNNNNRIMLQYFTPTLYKRNSLGARKVALARLIQRKKRNHIAKKYGKRSS